MSPMVELGGKRSDQNEEIDLKGLTSEKSRTFIAFGIHWDAKVRRQSLGGKKSKLHSWVNFNRTLQHVEQQYAAPCREVQIPDVFSFTSDGSQNKEVDTRIGKANAALRELHRCVLLKRDPSNTAKLSVLHQVWQKLDFLRRVHWVTLHDEVSSCEIRRALNVEPLLRIRRSQPQWFVHVITMLQEMLTRQFLLNTPTGTGPRGWSRGR